MCMKFCKKCCCMVIFAVITGGVIYYLKSRDCNGNEKGSVLADEAKAKGEKLKAACGCVKDQTKDIASEVKFAAQYTADEMKDSWKNTADAVKNAAANIKEDMEEMKDSTGSVFESGDHA